MPASLIGANGGWIASRGYAGGMGGIGTGELLIVLAIVVLVFGSTKLPKLARSLGQAQSEFKKGASEAGDPSDPDADKPST